MKSARPDDNFYRSLSSDALAGLELSDERAEQILTDPEIELMPLIHSAYAVRRHFWGRTVQVHVLNNAANGLCPEDCSYCSQAKTSEVDIESYPIKDDDAILAEAKAAYDSGAFRYCMVFAGRGPSTKRTQRLASLVRKIKEEYPLEICVSAGLLDDDKATILAAAGLDRLNHNLNTAQDRYEQICTTHTYADRIATLASAKRAGLATCSGVIAGMGESASELVEVAKTLRSLGSESIPVNFLLPFEGGGIDEPVGLSPEYCLRVLCMFRLSNPTAEVRCAAGREFHLKSLEPMALFVANSLFLDGYLNAPGSSTRKTYEMIRDAGFEIVNAAGEPQPIAELLEQADLLNLVEQPVMINQKSAIKAHTVSSI